MQQYWNGRIFEISEKNKFKYMVWEEAWYNGFPDEEDLGLNIKENVIIGIWKDFAQWDWARTLRKDFLKSRKRAFVNTENGQFWLNLSAFLKIY